MPLDVFAYDDHDIGTTFKSQFPNLTSITVTSSGKPGISKIEVKHYTGARTTFELPSNGLLHNKWLKERLRYFDANATLEDY